MNGIVIALSVWATGALVTAAILLSGFRYDPHSRPTIWSDWVLFAGFIILWPVAWFLAMLDVARGDE
jgi:hypothetical protein